MDLLDLASEREEHQRAVALEQARRLSEAVGVSASECDQCGDPIPAARRLAVPGCRLCVVCQERKERRQ